MRADFGHVVFGIDLQQRGIEDFTTVVAAGQLARVFHVGDAMIAENLEQRRSVVDNTKPIGNPAAVIVEVAFALRTAGTKFRTGEAVVFEADFAALVLALSLFQSLLHGVGLNLHLQRVRFADEDDKLRQFFLFRIVLRQGSSMVFHTVHQILNKRLLNRIDAAVSNVLTVFQLDLGFGNDLFGIALVVIESLIFLRSTEDVVDVAHVVAHDVTSFESGVDGKQNLRIFAVPDSLGAFVENKTAIEAKIVIDLETEAACTIRIEVNGGIAAVMEAVAHGFGKGASDVLIADNPCKLLMAAVQFNLR